MQGERSKRICFQLRAINVTCTGMLQDSTYNLKSNYVGFFLGPIRSTSIFPVWPSDWPSHQSLSVWMLHETALSALLSCHLFTFKI